MFARSIVPFVRIVDWASPTWPPPGTAQSTDFAPRVGNRIVHEPDVGPHGGTAVVFAADDNHSSIRQHRRREEQRRVRAVHASKARVVAVWHVRDGKARDIPRAILITAIDVRVQPMPPVRVVLVTHHRAIGEEKAGVGESRWKRIR